MNRAIFLATFLFAVGCGVPDDSPLQRASRLVEEGNPRQAIAVCDAVLAEAPTNLAIRLLRGQLHEQLHHRQLAIQDYESALLLQADCTLAQARLAALSKPRTSTSDVPTASLVREPLPLATSDVRSVHASDVPSVPDGHVYDPGSPVQPPHQAEIAIVATSSETQRTPPDHYERLHHAMKTARQRQHERELAFRRGEMEVDPELVWDGGATSRQIIRFDLESIGAIPVSLRRAHVTGRRPVPSARCFRLSGSSPAPVVPAKTRGPITVANSYGICVPNDFVWSGSLLSNVPLTTARRIPSGDRPPQPTAAEGLRPNSVAPRAIQGSALVGKPVGP